MEILLIVLIVAAASAYLITKFLKTWRQGDTCDCGCSGCDIERTCSETMKKSLDR
jgi:hypothetical protein